jgi:hypothetical protein
MPRLEVIVSEMPLRGLGQCAVSDGSLGARWNPQAVDSRQIGFVPAKPPRKRPCCKTCGGGSCVGTCKF